MPKRQLQPLGCLSLVVRFLRAKTKHPYPECLELLVMISEGTGLRRAPPRSGNFIPAFRNLLVWPVLVVITVTPF